MPGGQWRKCLLQESAQNCHTRPPVLSPGLCLSRDPRFLPYMPSSLCSRFPFLRLPCRPVSPGNCPNYSAPTFGHPSRLLPVRQHHLLGFSVSPSALASQVTCSWQPLSLWVIELAPGFWPGRKALRSHSALLLGVGPRAAFKPELSGHGTGRRKLRPKMEGS